MEAIYFISPQAESIDAFINDFKKHDKPMYACAHLFFTSSKYGVIVLFNCCLARLLLELLGLWFVVVVLVAVVAVVCCWCASV